MPGSENRKWLSPPNGAGGFGRLPSSTVARAGRVGDGLVVGVGEIVGVGVTEGVAVPVGRDMQLAALMPFDRA